MKHFLRSTYSFTSALTFGLAVGCVEAVPGEYDPAETDLDYRIAKGEQGQGPDLATLREQIIKGDVPPDGSLQLLGVVHVTSSIGSCTGTLLSNRHVLTARHCVRNLTNGVWGALGTNLQARLEGPGSDEQTIPALPDVMEGITGDFALFELEYPVSVLQLTDSFFTTMYTGSDTSLVDQTVFCLGYGINAYATSAGNLTSGSGILRTASLRVLSAVESTLFTVIPNSTWQITAFGDSGGTCLATGGQVAGVAMDCVTDGTDFNGDGTVSPKETTNISVCRYVAPGHYRNWVNQRILADVSIPAYQFVPALTSGITMNARVRSVNGTTSSATALFGRTVNSAALRSGWVTLEAETEPPGMTCGTVRATTPLDGTVTLQGVCLGHGVMAALL